MTNKKVLPQFLLYDSVYGNESPVNQYFVTLFNKLVSKYSTKNFYDITIIDYFLEHKFIMHSKIENFRKHYNKVFEYVMVNTKCEIIIKLDVINDKENQLVLVEYFYSMLNGELKSVINLEEIETFSKEKRKSNICLVKSEMGHLDTEDYDLPIPEIDIELNYGNDFLKIHNVILERLNSEHDKGIILLHGDSGTGKTSYLKYLTKYIKDKEILFIPPSMAEILSEPSIIPFLMDHKNSILIIEDAERVISDRLTNGSPAGVSNILNLTDGILGDCLNIQVIATFNMTRERIDKALLRKSRLICEWKFDLLNVSDTNKLLDKLFPGKEYTSKIPLPLSDIYTFDTEDLAIKKESKLGFN